MKRRKTRQQKIIADLKKKVQSAEIPSAVSPSKTQETFTLPLPSFVNQQSIVSSSVGYSPAYLKHDITKTGALTLAIISSQIALLFLLQHRIIGIPGLTY